MQKPKPIIVQKKKKDLNPTVHHILKSQLCPLQYLKKFFFKKNPLQFTFLACFEFVS